MASVSQKTKTEQQKIPQQKTEEETCARVIINNEGLKSRRKIVVIGASLIDEDYLSKDGNISPTVSNKLFLKKAAGGVGRNITEICTYLLKKPVFITVFGTGQGYQFLRSSIKFKKNTIIDMGSKFQPGKHISIFSNDNNLLSRFNIQMTTKGLNLFNIQKVWLGTNIQKNLIVVLQANFKEKKQGDLLQLLKNLNKHNCFIVFECKSNKSNKVLGEGILPYISLLRMNKDQFQLLSRIKEKQNWVCEVGSAYSSNSNRLCAIVTAGAQPIKCLYADGFAKEYALPESKEVVKTTGAGDAFTGALISALASALDLDRAISIALKVSGIVINTPNGISPYSNIDRNKLAKIIQQLN